ncbi:putative metal-dependent hydrolase [Methylobacterium aerolatum]|uniref:Metal-dependent hydrolase n=1 Tax=Methylobacterium aerolatum TaxID=418708 RepID=A0ABU0HTB0_9HYPH|nr:putative metal-dependent hydrolase [Methylobacterium aerolatum]
MLRLALRRRSAARRITLRVSSATGEAVITLPPRMSVGTAQKFAASHADWIATRLARVPERIAFAPGALVPIRGETHRLVRRGERSGPAQFEAAGGDLALSLSCGEEHFPRRVKEFLTKEARADILASVENYAPRLGKRPTRITLRDTTSRWGSCTTKGELNFSWRLILAPPVVLDYLVAHEMAHLREMNHSARFWAVAHDLCPHVDSAEAWLKRHGTGLHRFG